MNTTDKPAPKGQETPRQKPEQSPFRYTDWASI